MAINFGSKNYLIIAMIVVSLGIVGFLSWDSHKKDIARVELKKITDQVAADYQKQIEYKNTVIKQIMSEYKKSEQAYRVLSKKLTALKQENINVKPPITTQELRDRFTALGYPSR